MAEAMIHDKYIQSSNSTTHHDILDEHKKNHYDLESQFQKGTFENPQENNNCNDKPNIYITQHPASPLKIHHQDQQVDKISSKMVNFEPLPVSVKKSRPSTEQTAQKVIIAINHGVNKQDRKEAILNACAAFDHGVETAHDDEIRVGADTSLFKHLTLLLFLRYTHCNMNTSHDNSNLDVTQENASSSIASIKYHEELLQEISQTLEGLEMVLRCSAECVSVSFTRIGNELLPILLSIFSEIKYRRQNIEHMTTSTNISTVDDNTDSDQVAFNTVNEGNQEQNSTSQSQDMPLDPHTSNRHHASSIDTDDSTPITCADNTPHENSSRASFVSNSGPRSTNACIHNLNTSFTFPTSTGDKICKVSSKIIGHFARVGSLTASLAETPNLLTTLQEMIAMPKGSIPIESQMNALWVTANLACSAENMIKMAQHPKIIQTLVQVACHPNKDDEQICENAMAYLKLLRSRSIAVRALLNLSWAHENKIPMSENVTLVSALLATVSHRSSSWVGNGLGVSGVLLQSRRLAAGALRNLAAAPRRYKRRLCRVHESNFLDILADVASYDPDEDVRLKIHTTLFNLVSADTAKMFIEKQQVLNVIVKAASSGDPYVVEPGSDSSFITAIRTLKALEKAIPEEEENYEVLRPILRRFDSQIAFDRSQSATAIQSVEL
jgi:hypothetical protein